MKNHAWVEVKKNNIYLNAEKIFRYSKPKVGILPVVKADAYGLGSTTIASILDQDYVWGFAVATNWEGIQLRESGIQRPIIVLRPALGSDLQDCREFHLTPVVDDPCLLKTLDQPFHLEIDTGMSRGGLRWDSSVIKSQLFNHQPQGVFTHFHSSDESPSTVTQQLARFTEALTKIPVKPNLVYCANSAAAFYDLPFFDLVRPGIYLFGGCEIDHLEAPLPVVSLKTRVLSLRTINSGDTVSYNQKWRANQKCEIATLAVGYADGVPRNLDKDAYVLIRGIRCPIVGVVTMDMMMVDVSHVPYEIIRGEVATVFGQDSHGNNLSVTSFARWGCTIPYEILTRLGNRLDRVYV